MIGWRSNATVGTWGVVCINLLASTASCTINAAVQVRPMPRAAHVFEKDINKHPVLKLLLDYDRRRQEAQRNLSGSKDSKEELTAHYAELTKKIEHLESLLYYSLRCRLLMYRLDQQSRLLRSLVELILIEDMCQHATRWMKSGMIQACTGQKDIESVSVITSCRGHSVCYYGAGTHQRYKQRVDLLLQGCGCGQYRITFNQTCTSAVVCYCQGASVFEYRPLTHTWVIVGFLASRLFSEHFFGSQGALCVLSFCPTVGPLCIVPTRYAFYMRELLPVLMCYLKKVTPQQIYVFYDVLHVLLTHHSYPYSEELHDIFYRLPVPIWRVIKKYVDERYTHHSENIESLSLNPSCTIQ